MMFKVCKLSVLVILLSFFCIEAGFAQESKRIVPYVPEEKVTAAQDNEISDELLSEQAEAEEELEAEAETELNDGLVFETIDDKDKDDLVGLRQRGRSQEYDEELNKRIKNRRDYLSQLKQRDPEKYREIVNNAHEKIRKRLANLKEKEPERFRKLMLNRQRKKAELKKFQEEYCARHPRECAERRENIARKKAQEELIERRRHASAEEFSEEFCKRNPEVCARRRAEAQEKARIRWKASEKDRKDTGVRTPQRPKRSNDGSSPKVWPKGKYQIKNTGKPAKRY